MGIEHVMPQKVYMDASFKLTVVYFSKVLYIYVSAWIEAAPWTAALG